MTLYVGLRQGGTVDGVPEVRAVPEPRSPHDNGELLPVRLDLRNHSPNGFEWGYGGSGPSQLALAILAYELGDEMALKYYQEFKAETVARWGSGFWTISSHEVRQVITKLLARELLGEEASQ